MAAPSTAGKTMSDLGPDLSAVGNAARGSKGAGGTTKELTGFSVKKGDNGGVIVSEMYQKKAPEGRRASSFMLGGLDVKENPFSASDGAGAVTHITGLLGTMGIEAAAPAPEEPPMPELPAPMPEEPPAGPPPMPPGGGGGAPFKTPGNLAY